MHVCLQVRTRTLHKRRQESARGLLEKPLGKADGVTVRLLDVSKTSEKEMYEFLWFVRGPPRSFTRCWTTLQRRKSSGCGAPGTFGCCSAWRPLLRACTSATQPLAGCRSEHRTGMLSMISAQ